MTLETNDNYSIRFEMKKKHYSHSTIVDRDILLDFCCFLFFFVVSPSATDFLERLVSEMTCYVSSGMLNSSTTMTTTTTTTTTTTGAVSVVFVVLCAVTAAGSSGFSLIRTPEEFLGNIDSMDTSDGKKWLCYSN